MKKQIIFGITSALLTTSAAFAQTATTTFGALPSTATFGGTGIPTGAVEITTITGLAGGETLTLGMSATPFKQPVAQLPGSGNTYIATPGVSPLQANRATWNYDYYISALNGADLGNYTFSLIVSDGTTTKTLNPIAIANADGGKSVTANTREDSQNIAFNGYDITKAGVYTFDLQAFSGTTEIGDSAITVDVGSVPDATSTLPLLSAAVLGLAFVGRKVKATA